MQGWIIVEETLKKIIPSPKSVRCGLVIGPHTGKEGFLEDTLDAIFPQEMPLRQSVVDEQDDESVVDKQRQGRLLPAACATTLPFIPASDPRVTEHSTGALEVEEVPSRLLVIGGGIIGLEMATVYHELGAQITVVELLDQLIPGADRDVVAPLAKRCRPAVRDVYLRRE